MADRALGNSDLIDEDIEGESSALTTSPGVRTSLYNPGQTGVFALHPTATSKYSVNNGLRDNEFKETLARMYISLADASEATKKLYLNSLPKDDRIQALAKVLIGAGSGSAGGSGFIDFFLQQAQEGFREKLQVDEVLGDNYVAFYFGQEPPVFSYSGTLLNSQQDDQYTGFALAYQNLFRGTRLAERGALLRLKYNSVIISGTVNSMSTVLNAENELAIPFSFSMLVKDYTILRQPQYAKLSPSDFVQLATQFDPTGLLKSVGHIKDTKVRTTILMPLVLASESVVGAEESGEPINPQQTPPQQLQSLINEKSQPAALTTNVRGTLPAENQSLPPEASMSLPEGG